MTPLVTPEELADLERAVQHALETRDDSNLRILGYGEISLVVGWPSSAPRVACKRLPVFEDQSAAVAYGALVQDYVALLRDRGVDVVPTRWHTTAAAGGALAAYVVQPVLPASSLAPRLLTERPEQAEPVLGAIMQAVERVVGPDLGLDAQLSNWAWVDGGLHYFDVTTPMINDSAGRTRMDLGLLTSPLPAFTRPLVRRFVAPGIVADYHDRRKVTVDLVGNLHKEQLADVVATAIDVANRSVEPPLSADEIARWYRGNARMWEIMLRLRRADRSWQNHVRRRSYPFLLPRTVSR